MVCCKKEEVSYFGKNSTDRRIGFVIYNNLSSLTFWHFVFLTAKLPVGIIGGTNLGHQLISKPMRKNSQVIFFTLGKAL